VIVTRAFPTTLEPLFVTRSSPGWTFQTRTWKVALSTQPAREPAARTFPSVRVGTPAKTRQFFPAVELGEGDGVGVGVGLAETSACASATGAVVGAEVVWPPQAARLPTHRIAPSALFTIFLQWGFDAGCKSPLWGAQMTFVLLNHLSL
jgi:hypothetical protein